jgi:excisionase family DNA binding protein
MDSPLMDRAGAATYLATTERHIQDLWNRRQIPAIKVGRLVRFHRQDLDNYIAANRQGKPS